MTDADMKDAKPSSSLDDNDGKDTDPPSSSTDAKEEPKDGKNDTITSINTKDIEALGTYDEIEKSLGISEYLSSSSFSGFTAVVKARYSDFLVHEIDLDGNVARLTSLDVPKSEASKDTEKKEEVATKEPPKTEEAERKPVVAVDEKMEATPEGGKATGEGESESLPFENLESELVEMIKDVDVSKKVMVLLKSHEKTRGENSQAKSDNANGSEDNESKQASDALEKFVTLPSLEKEQRKAVHNWVRNSLKCARADTLDGKIRIWHARFETEMPNYKAFGTHKKRKMSDRALKKKARSNWPSDRPEFLRFVMYKENCDTTTATKDVMRRGSTARIGFAGMKDKRGITSQFCTLFKTLPEQIMKGTDSILFCEM
ncbi:unnamed protein product [Pseudo-nitzschia multistriata]|uniref:Uncharacterized protein n=1 Tax=Pseudo-nitzschia multistriata TaxID=183589 RepID=A0A448ZH34_9STRA|nr:unnamed protein product [Pseudo-nitzschia multistriata]